MKTTGKYILDGHTPVPCDDLFEWGRWIEGANPRVDFTEYPGGVSVSTVFLGLDHSHGLGKPLLFETMIFAASLADLDGCQERYSTWDEAEAGHARAVALVDEQMAKAQA